MNEGLFECRTETMGAPMGHAGARRGTGGAPQTATAAAVLIAGASLPAAIKGTALSLFVDESHFDGHTGHSHDGGLVDRDGWLTVSRTIVTSSRTLVTSWNMVW